jgi:hypothetical protein
LRPKIFNQAYICIITRREISCNIPDETFLDAKTVPDEMIGVFFGKGSMKACRKFLQA